MEKLNTLPTPQVLGIIIRLAKKTREEINKIEALEKNVWGEQGAEAIKIYSRLRVFPEGSYVAETTDTGEIVGYVCFQLTDDLRKPSNITWAEITDEGWMTKSHRSNGDYMYGINLSVHHLMNGKNLGAALVSQCFIYMIAKRKSGIFTGSRIPMFKSYREKHPEITAEEYVKLRRGKKFYDYELNLYHQSGLAPVNAKVIPNFFPDEASLNYGVLIFDNNPLREAEPQNIEAAIGLIVRQDFINLKKYAQ